MNIIYCHHAERNVDKKKLRNQNDDITENGIKDAELVAELLANQKITAIYTSDFYRCKKTAQIINRFVGAPIYEECRFNEVGSVEGEEWKDCLVRNIEALEDITNKYNDEDTIVCVTSGVNLSAFVCWNLKLKPNKDFPFMGATNCAPVIFYTPSKIKFREKKLLRQYEAKAYKRNKEYIIKDITSGEIKTYLKYELKNKCDLMELFTNKAKREYYIAKLGELERLKDMGDVEMRKYLSNKLAIDIMQLLKDICETENIDFDTIRSDTALELTEDQCIKNMNTYVERLFYLDCKMLDTLLLIYSTLVSYINYSDLSYEDIVKTCSLVEENTGSYLNGKMLYKL